MNEDFDDFGGIVAPAAEQLKSIEELANEAASLAKIVDEMEAALKAHKAELMTLTHKALPDAMAAAGTSAFTTTKGVKISIKEVMQGTLPKDDVKRAVALRWIEEIGIKQSSEEVRALSLLMNSFYFSKVQYSHDFLFSGGLCST